MRLRMLALALALVGPVFAKGDLDPRGKPDYKPGDSLRYGVWHDKDGWHLRTTTAKKAHHFKGRIALRGGRFAEVKALELEGKKDRFLVTNEKRTIVFDFSTDGAEDGLDFHCGPEAKEIEWSLEVGPGDLAAPVKKEKDRVFVGKKGEHPDDIPFTTHAHPGR